MGKKEPVHLEAIVEQALRIAQRNLKRLEEQMDADEESSEDGDSKFNVSRANALTGISRGLASMLKEARALSKMKAESLGNLGPTEKRRLLVSWFSKQPRESQLTLLHEMTSVYNARKKEVAK
jgi:hypothetical protein